MPAKQVKELRRVAVEAGWDVRPDGSGHLRLTPPDSKLGISISTTPGDVRAWRNNVAQLRRMGLDVATGETFEIDCGNTWHVQPGEGRFCPSCRQDWLVPEKPDKDEMLERLIRSGMPLDDAVNAVVSSKNGARLLEEMAEAKKAAEDLRPITERVREAIKVLKPGEFVGIAEIASLVGKDIDTDQVGAALRLMRSKHEITRTKRGRYGIPLIDWGEPEPATPELTPEPKEDEDVPGLEGPTASTTNGSPNGSVPTSFGPPPDLSREWRWHPVQGWVEATRAVDAPPMFELITTDGQGRLILKREDGELFCAVPLAAQF